MAKKPFAEAHHKNPTPKKSGRGPVQKILGFPFNISATAEASDFKFGTQLEFAKTHHKITPRRKSGRGLGLEELSKIWRLPFNI